MLQQQELEFGFDTYSVLLSLSGGRSVFILVPATRPREVELSADCWESFLEDKRGPWERRKNGGAAVGSPGGAAPP